MEKGHTYMRSDSIHGSIAKKLKGNSVYNYQHLIEFIEKCKMNIQVLEQSIENFIIWDNFPQKKNNKLMISQIKSAQFRKFSTSIFLKRHMVLKQSKNIT